MLIQWIYQADKQVSNGSEMPQTQVFCFLYVLFFMFLNSLMPPVIKKQQFLPIGSNAPCSADKVGEVHMKLIICWVKCWSQTLQLLGWAVLIHSIFSKVANLEKSTEKLQPQFYCIFYRSETITQLYHCISIWLCLLISHELKYIKWALLPNYSHISFWSCNMRWRNMRYLSS